MFSFLKKDPIRDLNSKRTKLLEEAMRIQRSGDLRTYALKMEAIDKLEKEIESLPIHKVTMLIFSPDVVVFWFRRDLRLTDNAGCITP